LPAPNRVSTTFDEVADALRAHGLGLTRAKEGPNALAELTHRGLSRRFRLEIRQAVRPSDVAALAARHQGGEGTSSLVLCRQLSEPVQAALRDHGIACADAAGNASIDEDHLLIWIAGKVNPAPRPAPARFGAATWRVAFAVLRHPERLRWTVRDLAAASGVSPAAAGNALQAFASQGWSVSLGKQGHRIVAPERLLDGWTQGFAWDLAPKLIIARAKPVGASVRAWAEAARPTFTAAGALLGGALATEWSGHPIHAEDTTVWVEAWNAETMRSLRLVPVTSGGFAVRSWFAADLENATHPGLAHPLVLLGELAADGDARLEEARASLRAACLDGWEARR